MRILYLSCHSILEMDEISLFHELGHEVFSPGAYWKPESGGDGMRPPLPQLRYKLEWIQAYEAISKTIPAGVDSKFHLTKDVVDQFDVIIAMHIPDFINKNWSVIKDKTVIWRTIGQSISARENELRDKRAEGMKIVRYSPRERNIPGYIGEDIIIRFYKDPDVYKGWNGTKPRVVTFGQSMQQRGRACNYETFELVTRPFPRGLYGPENKQPGFGFGKVPFETLLKEMRDNRVYFYTGTKPASYTLNFIEAWMTGIPMVCIGPTLGNSETWRDHNLYEIGDLVVDGVSGFISDDTSVLRQRVELLMRDKGLAAKISTAGRLSAINIFGKALIKSQWGTYLKSLE